MVVTLLGEGEFEPLVSLAPDASPLVALVKMVEKTSPGFIKGMDDAHSGVDSPEGRLYVAQLRTILAGTPVRRHVELTRPLTLRSRKLHVDDAEVLEVGDILWVCDTGEYMKVLGHDLQVKRGLGGTRSFPCKAGSRVTIVGKEDLSSGA